MTLTDNTRTDSDEYMRTRIEELIINGEVPPTVDDDVVLECARRYIAAEHNKRSRKSVRNVEIFHKTKVEERAKRLAKISVITTASAAEVLGWPRPLLGSTFTVDGVQVSWADATVEQHEARALWLEAHAAGTLETARIHRQAIADILAANQNTLAGVVDALIAC